MRACLALCDRLALPAVPAAPTGRDVAPAMTRNRRVAPPAAVARATGTNRPPGPLAGPLPPSEAPADAETPMRWTPADAALQAGMARAQERARRAAVNYYRFCTRKY